MMIKRVLIASLILLSACTSAEPVNNGSISSDSSDSSESSQSSVAAATVNETGLPLIIPDGFSIRTVAKLSGARDIVQDTLKGLWVSRPNAGRVTLIQDDGTTNDVFRGLRNPHGLAFEQSDNGLILYVAEETKISRAPLYTEASLQQIATLPAGGRHTSRTMEIGKDGRLYVSIGSTCDVCVERNDEHGVIISMNKDGSDRQIAAGGLRNAVFITKHPATGAIWATEMGRDGLGNDLPPEEVNIIEPGRVYGWPYCYGNQVRDTSFQPSVQADCSQTNPPHLTMPAHTAPLGLTFIPEEGWPEEYHHDLLVAQHGSWNSTVPVGYKIVRFPLDAQGNPEGEPVDFVSGFHNGRSALGRPVDVLALPGGLLYITDDKAGAVYEMRVQVQ
jgi:glucose/arabinose dehydrogenase